MSRAQRGARKHAKARQRRRLQAQERLAQDRRQAQHAAEALQQALNDLRLPQDLVTERRSVLRDVSCHGHQRATAHPGVEAAVLDRVLFPDIEALAGDWGLSSADRGCLLRPSGLTLDGVFCLDVHLTSGMPRASHDGRTHL